MTNQISGAVTGPVVQAGAVSGGVHVHVALREKVVPRQLPPAPRAFIGREWEVSQLIDLWHGAAVRRGAIVVSAINGMPGVGKTALVLHAGHLLAGQFPDGQFFLDLHAHTVGRQPIEARDALGSLLAADGVPPEFMPGGLGDRAALWRSRMADRRVLLVLDNAVDHTQVEPLLPAASGCLVLVTSRRRLSALDADPVELNPLAEDNATRMFLGLVPAAVVEHDTVAGLVRWCGHLPLAIALLAGVVSSHPTWTVADLLSDIGRATNRLSRMRVEDRAVAVAFDLSYQRLPGERQRLFRYLGLHPGESIDPYAAAALGALTLDEAAEHLRALYDDHLLDELAYGRYRMHDLIREYARTVASTERHADQDQAIERLLDYYENSARFASYALTRNPRCRTSAVSPPSVAMPDISDSGLALAWLQVERANLLASVDHSSQRRDYARVVGLSTPVAAFLRHVGPWDVADRYLRSAVAAARYLADPHSEADMLGDLGTVLSLAGNYPDAIDAFEQALAIYRGTADRLGEAATLNELGVIHQRRGEHDEAIRLQELALAKYHELGDRFGQAAVHSALGKVRLLIGEYPAATQLQESALTTYRDLGNRLGEANALTELGSLGWLTGDYAGASRLLQQAIDICQHDGYRNGVANALRHLGIVSQLTGDYSAACTIQDRALVTYRATGNRRGEANTLNELGIARWLSGDYDGARDALEHGLIIHRDIRDRRGEASELHQLGTVCRLTGRYAEGIDLLHQGLAIHREIGDRRGEANILNELANSLWLTGDYGQAADLLTAALGIQRDIGDQHGEANALQQAGAIRRLTGDCPAAKDVLVQALGLQRELGDRRGQATTLQQLGALHLMEQNHVAATDTLDEALRIHQNLADRHGKASTLTHIGALHLDRRQPATALDCYRRAIDLARSLGAPLEEARGLEGVGRTLRQTGDPTSAATTLRQAWEIYNRIGAADRARVATELPDPDNHRPPT